MRRTKIKQILSDLDKKMVFVTGPRQVGKTWLAKQVATHFDRSVYLNYDSFSDREIITKEQWPMDTELLILDELHKMKHWKNFLKGIYDTKETNLKILVTGSARLETFRQSGDSLAGRFFLHRLMPFDLHELAGTPYGANLDRLMQRGGFPEPFLAETTTDADRWRQQYIDGLVRTDILNFENIRELDAVHTIFELLRRKVGSTISYSSLARDAEISPVTAKKYVSILESLFIVFRVTPYSKKIARSILKEPKIYFFDSGLVIGSGGERLENTIANALYKKVLSENDELGKEKQLHFIRTKDKQEVDFLIVHNETPEIAIEVKTSDAELSPALRKVSEILHVPGVQVVQHLKHERDISELLLLRRAEPYLSTL